MLTSVWNPKLYIQIDRCQIHVNSGLILTNNLVAWRSQCSRSCACLQRHIGQSYLSSSSSSRVCLFASTELPFSFFFLFFLNDLCFLAKWICQPFPPLYWIIIKEPIERHEETSLWSNPVTLPLSYSGCQGNAPSQFPCINCRCISYFWLHPTCTSITTLPTTFFLYYECKLIFGFEIKLQVCFVGFLSPPWLTPVYF